MGLLRKKCAYCNEKIKKGKEFPAKVKVPVFKDKVTRYFCSLEHAENYKKFRKGTPSKNSCPYCN